MEKPVGTNVLLDLQGNILKITVDLSKTFGDSKSGKTIMIATTQGNVQPIPGVFLGINCYKKK